MALVTMAAYSEGVKVIGVHKGGQDNNLGDGLHVLEDGILKLQACTVSLVTPLVLPLITPLALILNCRKVL